MERAWSETSFEFYNQKMSMILSDSMGRSGLCRCVRLFKGKFIPLISAAKKNGTYQFASKQTKGCSAAMNNYGRRSMVQSLSFFQVL
jgi:hypothetical protein